VGNVGGQVADKFSPLADDVHLLGNDEIQLGSLVGKQVSIVRKLEEANLMD
jgi:hypothetical protein